MIRPAEPSDEKGRKFDRWVDVGYWQRLLD
jgi:hypothetical protein